MEFSNSFDVDATPDQVWAFMVNAREVTPCVPGAAITEEVSATHFKGTVKIKLGAVQVTYRGEIDMEPNEDARTIVLRGKGTELRGSGGASGTVTTTMSPNGSGTHVDIVSQVDVTGKVAQFGRGIMQDVANKLIKDFAACLERKLVAASAPAPEPQAVETARSEESAAETPATATATAAPSPRPAPPQPAVTTVSEPEELRLSGLVLHIVRTRLARGLRFIADRVEPE